MQRKQLTKQVILGILAGWAFVFRLLEFPLLGFLKLDFSDVPVLVGGLISGPVGAFCVALIRDILGYIRSGGEAGVPLGSLMSLVASMTLYGIFQWGLSHWPNKWTLKQNMSIVVTSTLALTLVMSVFNYFVALPLYGILLNFPVGDYIAFILGSIVPFNLIKGLIIGTLLVLCLPSVTAFLRHRGWLYVTYQKKM